jgi:hypothetical protein
MKNRPSTRFLAVLAFAVLALVIGVWSWSWRDRQPAAIAAKPAPVIPVRKPPVVSTPVGQPRAVDAAGRAPRGPVESASSGDTLRTSVLAAQLASVRKDLVLDPAETEKLTAIYLENLDIRIEIESRLARVASFDGLTVKVEIPHYEAEGRALRERFYGQLKASFPNGRFEQIDDYLGEYFDTDFKGFGIMDQVFTVSPRLGYTEELFRIKWEAKVAGDLTPSRLAAKDGNRWTGSGSESLMGRDFFSSDQLRAIEPILTEKFPPGRP